MRLTLKLENDRQAVVCRCWLHNDNGANSSSEKTYMTDTGKLVRKVRIGKHPDLNESRCR
jgi:hypothetical protein